MATDCHTQLTFSFQPKIAVNFDGGEITTDTGLLLLREFDKQLGLTKPLKGLYNDWRHPGLIEHETEQMLCQRVYQIAAGYEDCDDADKLRTDPTLTTVVGRREALASQPTLSRLENHADWPTIGRLRDLSLRWFLKHGYGKKEVGEEIVLDCDATDDPCHGQQVFAFFHGKYHQYMYHPLFFFEGHTGLLLSARLRPGNAHCAAEIPRELRRLVPLLRRRFPNRPISYRADAASAMPEIYQTLESLKVRYAMGIGTNAVFKRKTERWLERAQRRYARSREAVRRYYSFRHRARSWRKHRRVLVKIEVGPVGRNVRFVVTNRPGRAEEIFHWYEQRGECENHIKEFKRDLWGDRLSCHAYRANALRLQLHALAYQLMVLFRRHALRRTQLSQTRMETIRLRLFKVGARFKRTARRLWFHLSSSWPGRHLFAHVCREIARMPQTVPT